MIQAAGWGKALDRAIYSFISGIMELFNAIRALSALAQEGRLEAFRLLVRAGPEGLAAGEIARRLNAPPNTLSTRLHLLAEAGLVRSLRRGRSIIYRADYAAFERLLTYLIEDCCQGRAEVCTPLADLLSRAACRLTQAKEPA